jgi:NADPH:quinone reductase-like Zn-dependent oxidoreductase
MLAAQFSQYGEPDVLEMGEAPEPHAGPGEVRVVVHATSVNPIDWKIRAGFMAEWSPLTFPAIVGNDAAGVVDEVGEGVEGVALGDEVFGLGASTDAEFALLRVYLPKPETLSWAEAAALGVAGETSVRVLNLLGVRAGQRLLIDGGAGGVGSIAVQTAVARGVEVIATASERNHAFLTELGATPIQYGAGLGERVRAVAPEGIDAVFDVVGRTPIAELTALVADPQQVVSIANFGATEAGARVSGGGEGDPVAALTETATLAAEGKLKVEVQTLPLADIARAHRLSQEGHVRGKLVLVI